MEDQLLYMGFHWTPTEVSTLVLAIVTLVSVSAGEWYSHRVARKEAVAAFIAEAQRNAKRLNTDIIALNEERRQNGFLSTPFISLDSFALDRLPRPIPRELLARAPVPDDKARQRQKKLAKRQFATDQLSSLGSSITAFNAAVRRHEALVGQPSAFAGLHTGLRQTASGAKFSLACVAEFLIPIEDGKEVHGWLEIQIAE